MPTGMPPPRQPLNQRLKPQKSPRWRTLLGMPTRTTSSCRLSSRPWTKASRGCPPPLGLKVSSSPWRTLQCAITGSGLIKGSISLKMTASGTGLWKRTTDQPPLAILDGRERTRRLSSTITSRVCAMTVSNIVTTAIPAPAQGPGIPRNRACLNHYLSQSKNSLISLWTLLKTSLHAC
jgi:hypothetical protein